MAELEQEFSRATLFRIDQEDGVEWQLLIETLIDLSRYPVESLKPLIEFAFRDAPDRRLESCEIVSASDGLIQCDVADFDAMDLARATEMRLSLAGMTVDIGTKGSSKAVKTLYAESGASHAEIQNIAAGAEARRVGGASGSSIGADAAESHDGSRASGTNTVLTVNDPTDGWLNMRSGPGTGHGVIKRLDNGTSVRAIGQSGNWREIVDPGGETGWAYGPYLLNESGSPASGTRQAPTSSAGKPNVSASSGQVINETFTPSCSNTPIPIIAESRVCANAMRRLAEVMGCNKIDEMESAQNEYYSQCADEAF